VFRKKASAESSTDSLYRDPAGRGFFIARMYQGVFHQDEKNSQNSD
jgi:hypothetical protein